MQADDYHGDMASTYEARRTGSRKWRREHDAVAEFLQRLPRGLSVLDVPVGTGRFFPLYVASEAKVVGVDISPDMLDEARSMANETGLSVRLLGGSVLALPLVDNACDAVVCVRLLNWLTAKDVEIALAEISRVARKEIIISVATGSFRSRFSLSRLTRLLRRLRGERVLYIHSKRRLRRALVRNDLAVRGRRVVWVDPEGNEFAIWSLSSPA